MSNKFRYKDVKNVPSNPIISFKMEEIQDDHNPPLDENDDGFWPSLDKKSPGYVGENPQTPYDVQIENAKDRMKQWKNGDLFHIGIHAVAEIVIPCGQNSIVTYQIKSPGLWGVESDCGEEYKKEIFEQECEQLKEHILALRSAEFKTP